MEDKRQLYKQKYEAQLHEWSAKVDALKAHAEKLTVEAKLEMKPHLDTVHSKLEVAKAKLDDIARAGDDKWNDVVHGAEGAWHDAKAAIEGAHDAVMSKKPHGS